MMFITLEDYEDSVEIVLFPEPTSKYGSLVVPDRVLLIEGKVNYRDEKLSVIADAIGPVSPDDQALVILVSDEQVARLGYLKSLLLRFPGFIPVYIKRQGSRQMIRTDEKYWCDGSELLVEEVKRLFGDDAVRTSLLALE